MRGKKNQVSSISAEGTVLAQPGSSEFHKVPYNIVSNNQA
jgi:hypothetical protein